MANCASLGELNRFGLRIGEKLGAGEKKGNTDSFGWTYLVAFGLDLEAKF